MRVQFSVTQSEWQNLLSKAKQDGYPDVPTYCKDRVLSQKTYAQLWQDISKKIHAMSPGTTFTLRDLIETPPSNLGVKLYEHQKNLSIRVIKKDAQNANVFEKI